MCHSILFAILYGILSGDSAIDNAVDRCVNAASENGGYSTNFLDVYTRYAWYQRHELVRAYAPRKLVE